MPRTQRSTFYGLWQKILSPIIPSFGDSTIVTPNLSRLAVEGVCYDRFFNPSGICSPSRAAIANRHVSYKYWSQSYEDRPMVFWYN